MPQVTSVLFAVQDYGLPKIFGNLVSMANNLERLAAAVRERRLELGLRQDEMRDVGGPSTTTFTKIENATPPGPSASTLRKLDRSLRWAAGSAAALVEDGEEPIQITSANLEVSPDGTLNPVVTSRRWVKRDRTSTMQDAANMEVRESAANYLDSLRAVREAVATAIDALDELGYAEDRFVGDEYPDTARALQSIDEQVLDLTIAEMNRTLNHLKALKEESSPIERRISDRVIRHIEGLSGASDNVPLAANESDEKGIQTPMSDGEGPQVDPNEDDLDHP